MKNAYKFLALLLGLLMLVSPLTACTTPPTGADDTQTPGAPSQDTPGDADVPGASDGDTPSQPNPESGSLTPPDDSAVNAARYAYYPIISERMPAIHINTPNKDNSWATKYSQSHKKNGQIEYVPAAISVGNCEDEWKLANVSAQVKVRGNATLTYAKKPIRIKFDQKQSMLGLHDGEAYKSWVLLANWKDLSMSNNLAAFYLGNAILGSDGYYCTDFRNVEVYLDGEYWGVYMLVEQQEVKDGRTSVPEVPKGYTGTDIGYFFEFDGYYTEELGLADGAPTFVMDHGVGRSRGYTIKSDIYDAAQTEFLRNYMNCVYVIAQRAIEQKLYYQFNDSYTTAVRTTKYKSAKEAIGAVIDLQSLVDTYILNELACDADVDWSSFYLSLNMTADGNKKLTFEAPWDFDSAFGMVPGNCNSAEGMFAATHGNPWFSLIVSCDWFQEMVREKWAELKEYGVLDNVLKIIREDKETYRDYYTRNYTRWRERVEKGNWQCMDILNTYKDPATAQGLASDYLYDWLVKRIAYLDACFFMPEFDESALENLDRYRFEAESGVLSNFQHASPIATGVASASGKSYVGFLRTDSTITLTVSAKEKTTAYLILSISKYEVSGDFSSWFRIIVNGAPVPVPLCPIPAVSNGEKPYLTFIEVPLAAVTLKEGENVISIVAVKNTTNVDYLEIASEVEITAARGDAPPAGATHYRFEVENAALSGFTESDPIRKNKDFASGRAYVGTLRAGSTMTFTVTAAADCEAYLYAGLSKMGGESEFTKTFQIAVNGQVLTVPTRQIPAVSGNEEAYHTFIKIPLTSCMLKKGENTVVLSAIANATNVDYIEIAATAKVQ